MPRSGAAVPDGDGQQEKHIYGPSHAIGHEPLNNSDVPDVGSTREGGLEFSRQATDSNVWLAAYGLLAAYGPQDGGAIMFSGNT